MSTVSRLLGCLLVLLAALPAFGQDRVSVRADVRPTETYLGEPVSLIIVVDGANPAEGPDPSAFAPDFHASEPSYQNRSSSRTTIINGVAETSETVGCALVYSLRPLRGGDLTVPAVDVTAGGRTFQTRPQQIRVVPPRPSSVAQLSLRLSKERVHLEEPVTVELIVRLRELALQGEPFAADPWYPRDPLELRIPWFQQLEDFDGGDFVEWARPLVSDAGFSVNGITSREFFNERVVQFAFPLETVERDGVRWREYRLERTFRPLVAGEFPVPVSTLRGSVVTRVELRGRQGSPVAAEAERVFVDHDPVVLTVEPVPTAGRPATYVHAIGSYRVESAVEPQRAKVGDPMKLTVRIWGDGLVARVLAPNLANQADLARDFAVGEPDATPEMDGETKLFTYTIRPRHAEIDAVPPIEFAFFDPAEGGFDVALSKEIDIDVEEATEVGAADLIGGVPAGDRASSPGEELTGGLLANRGFAEMLADESRAPGSSPVFWLLLLGAPATYGGLALAGWRRRRLLADPLRERAERALDVARGQLARAREQLAANDTGGAAESLHHALAGFVAARARRPAGGMTAADVRALLVRRGIESVAAAALVEAAEMCERVRFGGAGADELSTALGGADDWLVALRKESLA